MRRSREIARHRRRGRGPGYVAAIHEGGDINIHANGETDAQTLNLSARAANDVLVLGDSTHPVVFTPTYGDSGAGSSITLMSKRTGLTTLSKVGAGTVEVNSAAFTHTDGVTSVVADSSVVDGGSGALTAGDIVTAGSATMTVATTAELQASNISGLGNTTVDGSLTADSIVQNTLTIGAGGSVTIRETPAVAGGANVHAVPEPGTLVLLAAGIAGLLALACRRRR